MTSEAVSLDQNQITIYPMTSVNCYEAAIVKGMLKELYPNTVIEDSLLLDYFNSNYSILVARELGGLILHGVIVAKVATVGFVGGKAIHVDSIYINTEKRGLGVGKKLFEAIHDHFKNENPKAITLNSKTTLHQAHGFYHKHKFHIRSFNFVKDL